MKSAIWRFLIIEKCLVSAIKAVYSFSSGRGSGSWLEESEKSEELLLIRAGRLALLMSSESESMSDAIAEWSFLSIPEATADIMRYNELG